METNHTPINTPDEATLQAAASKLKELEDAVGQVIFGQEELIRLIVVGILSKGHLLLEGLPGLGKTELVKIFANCLGLNTQRIQFTPDLLPGDITGNPMLQEVDGERQFVFQKGPVFTNLLLADEINRASPKTQSAMLEAMQEGQVSAMGKTHPLPKPFFVMATQNPIELEGTYPLPEAQIDRFLFKISIFHTSAAVLERIIHSRVLGEAPTVETVLSEDELKELMALVGQIYLPPVVANYIARLVDATQPGSSKASQWVQYGASPRAAIGFSSAARARALMEGRLNASFDDVKAVAMPILRHRLILNYQAKIEGQTSELVVEKLLEEVNPEVAAIPNDLKAAKID